MTARLSSGGTYLLYAKLHENAESIAVASIVEDWSNIVLQKGQDETLLTMVSYYMDNLSKQLLTDKGVKYIAAFTANRFNPIMTELKHKLTKEEDWYAIHNPETKHSVTYYWSSNEKLGKKWVMSNACEYQVSRSKTEGVPLYDLYGATFSVCDNFNRRLQDRTWPHKKGGYRKSGCKGKEFDFILSCILHNTFEYFFDINRLPSDSIDFCDNCLLLAHQLFSYANTIIN